MTHRPILMSAPMVRALLDGTKTQTRRVVKLPDWAASVNVDPGGSIWGPGPYLKAHRAEPVPDDVSAMERVHCPYGVPGDTLWVKESIRRDNFKDTSHFMADGAPTKADAWPWKVEALSGRFMPKGLSRFMLTITELRAQRLHDISQEDCAAEGIRYEDAVNVETRTVVCPMIDQYAALWNKINGDGAWALNPYVWALTFTVEAH